MSGQGEMRVWLQSVEYSGRDVGSDTEFDITVNGEAFHVRRSLKFGIKWVADRLLATTPAQHAEEKVSIVATVTERDRAVDDIGQSSIEYRVRKGQPRSEFPALHVSVQEDRGRLGKGATALFISKFEI